MIYHCVCNAKLLPDFFIFKIYAFLNISRFYANSVDRKDITSKCMLSHMNMQYASREHASIDAILKACIYG